MARHRRYTPQEKATAVGIAAAQGVTAAERQTGIPITTIHYWTKSPEFAELRSTAREAVIDQFWVAIQTGLQQVSEGLRGEASLKDKAIALATLYDRHALLTGGATARSENRDITGTITDAELIATVLSADARTRPDGDPETAPDAPEGSELLRVP